MERSSISLLVAALALLGARVSAQGCTPDWVPTFGPYPDLDQQPRSMAVFDPGDGSGPGLYLVGDFEHAGTQLVGGFARWDGTWSAASLGPFSSLTHLFVFDDGSGPVLIGGGKVGNQTRIGSWDGTAWTLLGGHLVLDELGGIEAFATFDAGAGPELYVTGGFTTIDGVAAARIARWDGASWHPLLGGLNASGGSLAVFDDGAGPALFVGGAFTDVNGSPASSLARWDGSAWSSPSPGPDGVVAGMIVHDDGNGPALFLSGDFASAGGVPANHVARWDGTVWSALGSGTDNFFEDFAVYDDGSGSGPQLFVGGSFATAGGVPTGALARWDGAAWSGIPGVAPFRVGSLGVYDDGSGAGPALFVGGANLFQADGAAPDHLARWDGLAWQALADGVHGTLTPAVRALACFDDHGGSGAQLYAGGSFLAGGAGSSKLAKWNGASWESLLPNGVGSVNFLQVHDDGSGEALYVAGSFTSIGGVPAASIARWDGTVWSAVGDGSPNGVGAMTVFDDGSGARLVATGTFPGPGGALVGGPAAWDGVAWAALGTGFFGGSVLDLLPFEANGQPRLVASGTFTMAGVWDGVTWAPLGAGMDKEVTCLAVLDQGAGPELYAGGRFTLADGLPAGFVARWDGASWNPLVPGVSARVWCMTVFDDGDGPDLYLGGDFTNAGPTSLANVARWDGSSWSPLGLGLGETVRVLGVTGDGSGPGSALVASGTFFVAPESQDSFLALWQGCPDTTAPVIHAPTGVEVAEAFSGPPGEVVSFSVTVTDTNDPHPTLACVPPSGSFFPRGTTQVTCTATDAAGNQAVTQFPVTVRLKARPR